MGVHSHGFSFRFEADCSGSRAVPPNHGAASVFWTWTWPMRAPSVIPKSTSAGKLEIWEAAVLWVSCTVLWAQRSFQILSIFRKQTQPRVGCLLVSRWWSKYWFQPSKKKKISKACVRVPKSSALTSKAEMLHPSLFQELLTCSWQIPPKKWDVPIYDLPRRLLSAERRHGESGPATSPEHPSTPCWRLLLGTGVLLGVFLIFSADVGVVSYSITLKAQHWCLL